MEGSVEGGWNLNLRKSALDDGAMIYCLGSAVPLTVRVGECCVAGRSRNLKILMGKVLLVEILLS